MKQIYFLFVVLLVVMAACGGKKETSVDAEQLMFQIDSVDHDRYAVKKKVFE